MTCAGTLFLGGNTEMRTGHSKMSLLKEEHVAPRVGYAGVEAGIFMCFRYRYFF